MAVFNTIVNFLFSPAGAGIFGGLWLISEALANIPAIKQNSVYEVIATLLKKLAGKS